MVEAMTFSVTFGRCGRKGVPATLARYGSG